MLATFLLFSPTLGPSAFVKLTSNLCPLYFFFFASRFSCWVAYFWWQLCVLCLRQYFWNYSHCTWKQRFLSRFYWWTVWLWKYGSKKKGMGLFLECLATFKAYIGGIHHGQSHQCKICPPHLFALPLLSRWRRRPTLVWLETTRNTLSGCCYFSCPHFLKEC